MKSPARILGCVERPTTDYATVLILYELRTSRKAWVGALTPRDTHEGLEVATRTLMPRRADQPELAKSECPGVRHECAASEPPWHSCQRAICDIHSKSLGYGTIPGNVRAPGEQYNARAARNVHMTTACPMCSMSRSAPHHNAVSKRIHGREREYVGGLAWQGPS
ncbi:hypothetical protein L226DRAFT_35852 [Lentinus tigrinus ALCF2SS1-7]|uniref:uncharacterized protein n=1 Tax=Lentinus tigrinus ALCF2SS1-7 TaxID=1328758 RepID=UPI001165DA93|nr:hypothetical protein L226DRAFT_35852 [Lentinus tigrinus ALCF2SS1-7]